MTLSYRAFRAQRNDELDRALVLILLILASFVGRASAQTPSEDPLSLEQGSRLAGLSGKIYDREGPVAGAQIELTETEGSRRRASSSQTGSFRFPALPIGRWQITVEADGHLPSRGFVVVASDLEQRLDVELRRLDEGTPSFVEEDPASTVRRWLERGNALLDQGQTEAARAEYQKTLSFLEASPRAEVWRAIARTHYLEQALEESASALWQALLLEPDSTAGRQLYSDVMAQLGREHEAGERLAELDANPAPIESQSESHRRTAPGVAATGSSPAPTIADPEPPVAHRKGSYVVQFSERNPLGTLEEVDRRYGLIEEWLAQAEDFPPERESYSVHVPDGYQPGSGWGLLVWVSPTANGGLGRAENLELLEERHLIWIGANRAGNARPLSDRIGLALDAAQEMQRFYDIDSERIYVAGYSGGGRMASALALLWPEVFRGGVAWFGVSWWAPVPVPFKPGHSWPAAFKRPDRKSLARLRDHARLALVTGDLDFNRSETRQIYELMKKEGIEGVTYLQIPDADHYFGVDAKWLGKALSFLDHLSEATDPAE